MSRRVLRRYGFAWVTGLLFLASLAAQLVFQAQQATSEAAAHGQAFTWDAFWPEFLASVFENWQSEFLQLIWQAAGLSFLYFWGSSQSKEGDEQMQVTLARIEDRLARVEQDLHR